MKPLFLALACTSISLPINAYEAHEWGTFTTVSGSDGSFLPGLHVEEEQLPPFVYSHAGMEPSPPNLFNPLNMLYSIQSGGRNRSQHLVTLGENNKISSKITKGLASANLKNVTVKMETPVIYFYGDDTPKVHVKVDFHGGTISQWYPQRKAGDTPNKVDLSKFKLSTDLAKIAQTKELVHSASIDFSKPYLGSIEWDVDILPKALADPAHTFKADENHTWIYPRVPDANMLKVGDEHEDYLFYRGLGNFTLPVTFRVDSNETLIVDNKSSEAVPFAFAFENIQGKFRYKTIGKIPSNKQALVKESDWITPSQPQVEVFQHIRQGLLDQGLTADESNGMIKTWWRSYFNKPGLRVFWVVPNNELEKVLPLSLSPKPEKLVRVMVGRADVLRPRAEKAMVDALGTKNFQTYQGDRFFPAYEARLKQLVTLPFFTKFDTENIQHSRFKILAQDANKQHRGYISLIADKEVKLEEFELTGDWKILDDKTLEIGDTRFILNPKNGSLSAQLAKASRFTKLEIQLNTVLK